MHRSFTWSKWHRASQICSKGFGPRLVQLPTRHCYHSGPKSLLLNKAPSKLFRIVAASTLAGLGYAVHLYWNSIPLVLENWVPITTDLANLRGNGGHANWPLDIDQANSVLRMDQVSSSEPVGGGSGILRTDAACLPSNFPCEDEYFRHILAVDGRDDGTPANLKWMAWGVFDGHL